MKLATESDDEIIIINVNKAVINQDDTKIINTIIEKLIF